MRDSLAYVDSANLYSYVVSDPVGARDPFGEQYISANESVSVSFVEYWIQRRYTSKGQVYNFITAREINALGTLSGYLAGTAEQQADGQTIFTSIYLRNTTAPFSNPWYWWDVDYGAHLSLTDHYYLPTCHECYEGRIEFIVRIDDKAITSIQDPPRITHNPYIYIDGDRHISVTKLISEIAVQMEFVICTDGFKDSVSNSFSETWGTSQEWIRRSYYNGSTIWMQNVGRYEWQLEGLDDRALAAHP